MTTVITARLLGPDGRGVYVAAISWAALFATFSHLSLSQVIIHLAAGKPQDEWLSRVMGSLVVIVTATTILGWIVAAIMYWSRSGALFHHLDGLILMLALLTLPALIWLEDGNGVLMALDKLPVMNFAQIAGASASLLFTFVAVGLAGLGVKGALVATLLAQLTTVGISLGYVFRQIPRLTIDVQTVRTLLKGGAMLHFNAIGSYLFTQANVLILNHYRSTSETAQYQLAMQLLFGMQIIPMAVSSVTYALVSRLGPDGAWPQHRQLLLQVVLLMLVLAGVAYFVAPLVVRLVFGVSFLPAAQIFRILLLGVLGMTMALVMASQWISRGLFLQAASLTLLVGAATVAGNYLVVPKYGMFGAAWVTVGTYGTSVIGNSIMFFWVEYR
ncbi:MAG TPA: oligosaccharide flippase family protein, partial [Thermoanaerobaculia bacterium]|nr:oligosaccharide flippase family protein [Thermoanaerobaculia bacterium]